MRNIFRLTVLLFSLVLVSCDDVEGILEDLVLTDAEIAEGLKEALNEGVDVSTQEASAVDGYLANEIIKILLPDELLSLQDEIENGQFFLVSNKVVWDAYLALNPNIDEDPFNELITAMNRGAESAATKASPIFLDAITNMSISDALNILQGGETAATEFFVAQTSQSLIDAFQPDITDALGQTQALDLYDDIYGFLSYSYSGITVGSLIEVDLPETIDGYATEKAVEGLFYLIGEEEKKIRDSPFDYASDIIQKVFGSNQAQNN